MQERCDCFALPALPGSASLWAAGLGSQREIHAACGEGGLRTPLIPVTRRAPCDRACPLGRAERRSPEPGAGWSRGAKSFWAARPELRRPTTAVAGSRSEERRVV